MKTEQGQEDGFLRERVEEEEDDDDEEEEEEEVEQCWR
jgi:hypothetical protein